MAPVWFQNALCSDADARLPVSERGFLLGDGLFETIRIRAGQPCLWSAHRQRLTHGCDILGLPQPPWEIIEQQAIQALITARHCVDGSMRLTWTRGSGGPRGLLPSGQETPTLLITVSPAAAPSGFVLPGLSLITASVTRRNEFSPMSRLKSLNYGDGLLARREAAAAGADDAVLLNTQGRVAETSIASLFLYLEGRWLTPPVSEGALPGVRRQQILAAGLAEEAPLTPASLASAGALVVTNALFVRQVARCDGRLLPDPQATRRWEELAHDRLGTETPFD